MLLSPAAMALYLRETEAGCALAREREAIAVIVSALGAGLMLPHLFDRGAAQAVLCAGPEQAAALRAAAEGALLAGRDRGAEVRMSAAGLKRVSRRLLRGKCVLWPDPDLLTRVLACRGAAEVHVGGVVNAPRLAQLLQLRAAASGRDIVLIPAAPAAGEGAHPEDSWAAAYLASLLEVEFAEEQERAAYEPHIAQVIRHGFDKLLQRREIAGRLERLKRSRDLGPAALRGSCRSIPSVTAEILAAAGETVTLSPADTTELWLHARW
ncbi:MAG: hypothetical protein KatS3mg102_0876 [Planctomycetota bacterium]|nr:MAG: hypothetical protein KatS3mg102_0876 [Planctomycetota bacterium]